MCPNCDLHIGWIFEPIDRANSFDTTEDRFYALIVNNIISEQCKEHHSFNLIFVFIFVLLLIFSFEFTVDEREVLQLKVLINTKMVDPNRKINILTKEQDQFLEECEEEFKNRFTEDDEEFMEFCKRPEVPPPIVDQWMMRRNFNHNRNDHNHRGGYNNNRGRFNNSSGGRGGGHFYHRHGGGGGGSTGGGNRGGSFNPGGGGGAGSNRYGHQQDYKRQAFNYNQNQ